MASYGRILNQWSVDTGITQKEMAAALNYTQQRVSNWYRGKAEPPFEFLEKFRSRYNVDLRQLIKKEENGIRDGLATSNPIPVYDLDLKPVKELDFFNYNELVSYYIGVPSYNDCFAALKVPGVSMSPAFNPSDIVAVKRIINFDTIPLGEAYFLILEEQRLIRYVRLNEADPKKTFILKAENPAYDDMIIEKTDIKYLFQIKGKMTRL